MSWLFKSLNSSIAKKIIMALTGSMLMLFLIIHFLGNLTLFKGAEAFNAYVNALQSFKAIIRVIEVALAAVFLYHIYNGLKLWLENRKAKPVKYEVNASGKNSSFFSRWMFQTGSIIFIFLVIHLQTFWYTYNFSGPGQDLYQIVSGLLTNFWYSLFYVIAMILLGFHLNHGFQSAFQTFGWNHVKYFGFIQNLGRVYAWVMAIGFASIPVFFYFFRQGAA